MITFWKQPEFKEEFVKYGVYQQEECPKTKKQHYQGYVEFKDKMSMKKIKEIFNDKTIHIEPRKGNQEQAINYCTKEESRVSEPVHFGTKKCPGSRSDLDSICEAIEGGYTTKEILHEFKGNALRHINMISKGLRVHYDCCPMDAMILQDRLYNKSNPLYEEPKKCPEVDGNTGVHLLGENIDNGLLMIEKCSVMKDETKELCKDIKRRNAIVEV